MNINNEYELSFHKVFHNKFILRKILNFIHTSEHIEYEQVHQIHFKNRIKFKDIKSLGFLVSTNQISLLKCKLESNEYIEMDVKSIEQLFKKFRNDNSGDGNGNNRTDINTIEKIINLLMVNERNNFEICDLTEMAIKCNSIDVFNILINEPYSLQVLPSTLKLSIINCSASVVKQLLDLQIKSYGQHIVDMDIKDKSLIYATENKIYGEEMVNFIFSSPVLFDFGSLSIKKVSTDNNSKRIKTLDHRKNKISFPFFSKMSCWETKIKLVEMGLVSKKGSNNHFKNMNLDSLPYQELYLSILIESKFKLANIKNTIDIDYKEIVYNTQLQVKQFNDNSTDMNEKERIKELRKLITRNCPSDYYENYIIKYHETINEIHNDGFISNNDGSFKSELLNLVRFSYLNQFDKDKPVGKIMNKYKSQIDTVQQTIPFSIFNYIKSRKLSITDKSVYELIVKDYPILFEIIGDCDGIVVNYPVPPQIKIKINSDISEMCRQSFLNCDIDSIKNLKTKTSQFNPSPYLAEIQLNSNNFNRFIMMFDYFIETKFSHICPIQDSLSQFFNQILKYSEISNQDKKLLLDTFKSKVENGCVSYEVFEHLFYYSVKNLHFKLIKFYIGWFQDRFTLPFNRFNRQLYIFNGEFEIFRENYKCNKKMICKLVSILEYSINEFGKLKSTYKLDGESYETLINYLFEKLIQIQGVKFETIKIIYNLMELNGVKIVHGLYHSFYYISIKSIKLAKYILSNRYILTPIGDEDGLYYDCSINHYSYSGIYDIKKYLKPSIFTFDFIFNSTQDTILLKLIDQLSHGSCNDNEMVVEGYIWETLSSDLKYLLEIKRFDLFFQQLDYINIQLNNGQFSKDPEFTTINITFNSPALNFKNGDNVDLSQYPSTTPELPLFTPSKYQLSKSFKISNYIIEMASILFNVEEIEKFIEYNQNVTGFHISLLKYSIKNWNEPVVKFIIDNYHVPQHCLISNEFITNSVQLKFILENYFNQVSNPTHFNENYNNYQLKIFILSAINQFTNYINLGDNFYNYFIQSSTESKINTFKRYLSERYIKNTVSLNSEVNIYNLFDSAEIQPTFIHFITELFIKSNCYQLVENYETDNLFYNSFVNGFIDQCNLILKYYPNQFTISKSLLSKTIKNNQIHIIKYYYQNHNTNLISNINGNNELIDYLKNELSPLLIWLK